jgi:hypothetical protein
MDEQQDARLTEAEAVTIPQAARTLGLDDYTVYTLIQRERAQARLSPSGEFVVPKDEVNRLLKKD